MLQFGLREAACIAWLSSALNESGLANLFGPAGVGKTHMLRRFAEQLPAESCAFVDCRSLSGNPLRFMSELKNHVRPWQGREGRFVLILDDWCSLARDLRESETLALERVIYVALTRGAGSGVVFGSRVSVRDGDNNPLPQSVLANIIEINVSDPSKNQRVDHWERLLIQTRNRLAHQVDVDVELEQLRQSPWWESIQRCLAAHRGDWSADTQWAVLMLAEAMLWGRFLSDLCTRTPWLLEESRAHGYDPLAACGPVGFAEFLARKSVSPEQFIAELLRPSDLDGLFPETRGEGDKAARIVVAKSLWQRREAAK